MHIYNPHRKSLNLLITFSFLLLFAFVGSVEASAKTVVGQPCYFEHGFTEINSNRSHEDNGIGEAGAAVDLGANSIRPIAYGVIKNYQTCSGDLALASISGTVTTGFSTGPGYYVFITNPSGLQVRYYHLASISVAQGQNVKVGDQVGIIGSSGTYTTFQHIHFEVWKSGVRLRYPQAYFSSINDWEFGVPFQTTPGSITMHGLNVNGTNRIYQTVRGRDNIVFTRWSKNGINWSYWEPNTRTTNKITLEVYNKRLIQSRKALNGKLELRATKADGTWSPWQRVPRYTADAIETYNFRGVLYQAVRAFDSSLYIRNTTSGLNWTPWRFVARSATRPTLAGYRGSLFLTFQDTTSRHLHTYASADGVNWTYKVSSNIRTFTPIEMQGVGTILVQAIRGGDNILYTRRLKDGVWSNWKKQYRVVNGDIDMELFGGYLYITFRSDDNIVRTARTTDGINFREWNASRRTNNNISLAVSGNRLYQSMVSISGTNIFTRSRTSATGWSAWNMTSI